MKDNNHNIEISDDLDKKDALLNSMSADTEENNVDNENKEAQNNINISMTNKVLEFFLDYTFMISFLIISIQKNVVLEVNKNLFRLATK